MSITESIWKEARELPLKDAAFQLWRYRHRFDDEEFVRAEIRPRSKVAAEAEHMKTVMAQIKHEHDFAHEGPNFTAEGRARGKGRDIREAIKAAVKMMDACEKYFDGTLDFGAAIDNALARAKRENPGFLDDTWYQAGNWLVYVMK